MKLLQAVAVGFFLLFAPSLECQTSNAPIVRFHTNLGDIVVQLLPEQAPNTVANFLAYMNAGSYTNSIIHRSVPGFVWQGGGYQLMDHGLVTIPANAPVNNEFAVSNTAGTLAMALTGTDINSATTQWFFNEVDNSSNLDAQFFTVFGRIGLTDTASMAVLNSIATVPVYTSTPLGAMFNQIPLLNYDGSSALMDSNYVLVESISEIGQAPAIAANGVITASDFGGYPAAAPGSYIEIYGSNLAGTTAVWTTANFSGNKAPVSLDNVSVTVDGFPAYVYFVSPSQVDVQVPEGVSPALHEGSVILTYDGQVSVAAPLAIRPYEGALLATPGFDVNGTQYVTAFHANGTPVSNGKIPGTTAAPAAPGEELVFYGLGFGPVLPSSFPVAGEIATGTTHLANPIQFTIGQSQAPIAYAGFSPGFVGLYQFNVVVPANTPSGDQPLTVTLGPASLQQTLPQTLFLTVQASN